MTIYLVKFRTILTSHPLGYEAFAAFRPTLDVLKELYGNRFEIRA